MDDPPVSTDIEDPKLDGSGPVVYKNFFLTQIT